MERSMQGRGGKRVKAPADNAVLVVGSIAIDSIRTPHEARDELLGGSASYAAAAAGLLAPVRLVGVVGEDFPAAHRELYVRRGIDLAGLQIAPGRTFRWAGEYEPDMNRRRTLLTELNVFETFSPELPAAYCRTPYILLGNIHPALQQRVLDQIRAPRLVACDTMDLWIRTARPELLALLPRVDLLALNDSEARELTGRHGLLDAGQAILDLGPRAVVIKKGEHGAILLERGSLFVVPAFPLPVVRDPTGAGDAFLGGLVGWSARCGRRNFHALCRAVVAGTILASFAVEEFSPARLCDLTLPEMESRLGQFRQLTRF